MARKRIQIPFSTIHISIFGHVTKDIVILGLKTLRDLTWNKPEMARYYTETLRTNVSPRTVERRLIELNEKSSEELMKEDINTAMSLQQREGVINDT